MKTSSSRTPSTLGRTSPSGTATPRLPLGRRPTRTRSSTPAPDWRSRTRSDGSPPFRTGFRPLRLLGSGLGNQVACEPVAGEFGRGLQRAGFLEEVGGTGDDSKAVLAAKLCLGLAVEVEDGVVLTAHNEQGGSGHRGEPRAGEVGSAAAGHHGGDLGVRL